MNPTAEVVDSLQPFTRKQRTIKNSLSQKLCDVSFILCYPGLKFLEAPEIFCARGDPHYVTQVQDSAHTREMQDMDPK